MYRQPPNTLFCGIKDKTPTMHMAMNTFAVKCFTCQCDIFFNAIDITIKHAIARAQNSPVGSANRDHEINWEEPRIIAKHSTRNKANTFIRIMYDCVAAEGSDPHFEPYKRNDKHSNDLKRALTGNMYNVDINHNE